MHIEALSERLKDSIVFRCKLISQLSLPGIGPASVQASHRVCIRAAQQNTAAFRNRKDSVVLQQDLRLNRRSIGSCGRSGRSKIPVIRHIPYRMVKQAKPEFHPEDSADSIVNPRHRHGTLLHKFLEMPAETPVRRDHRHINSGIDSEPDCILFAHGNPVPLIEVVDVVPVSHNHAVPVEIFLKPYSQEFPVAVKWHSVVR